MCRTANLIHRKKSEKDLRNEDIAKEMVKEGVHVSGDMVQKYFSGTSGVPIENLGPFLRAIGLKIVPAEMPEVDSKEFQALKMFAGKYLTGGEEHAD